nr:DNA modification methyltransferase [uncultured bacterium]
MQASSREGDWVLDLFGGSGTTGAVAASLGRRFVLVDTSPDAVAVIRRRLAAAKVPARFVESAP